MARRILLLRRQLCAVCWMRSSLQRRCAGKGLMIAVMSGVWIINIEANSSPGWIFSFIYRLFDTGISKRCIYRHKVGYIKIWRRHWITIIVRNKGTLEKKTQYVREKEVHIYVVLNWFVNNSLSLWKLTYSPVSVGCWPSMGASETSQNRWTLVYVVD